MRGYPEAGFTGTQRGMTSRQKEVVRLFLSDFKTLHHGDCIGADEEAHEIARDLGLHIVSHPPEDPKKRAFCVADETFPEKPYLVRNRDIVKEGDLLIGCPKTKDRPSSLRGEGTWWTITEAEKWGKKVAIVFPDGNCVGSAIE